MSSHRRTALAYVFAFTIFGCRPVWPQDGGAIPDPEIGRHDPEALEGSPDDGLAQSQPFYNNGRTADPSRRQMPFLGPTVVGPGGVIPPPALPPPRRAEAVKPKILTPEERAAAIRKALAPKPSFTVSRRQTLARLYGKLAVAADADEAKGLAGLIGNIWLRSSSDTAALLMQRAMTAVDKKDLKVALDLLDRIVEMQPNWAEAWNKRAAVRYSAGNLDGSMEDVEHVLKLDPNHFAALEGMAVILQHTGFDKRALQVYRRALAIYPHQPEIEDIVRKLQREVEGQGI